MQTTAITPKYDNYFRIYIRYNIGENMLFKKDAYTKDEDRYKGMREIVRKRYVRSYAIKIRIRKIMTRNVEWLREYKHGKI